MRNLGDTSWTRPAIPCGVSSSPAHNQALSREDSSRSSLSWTTSLSRGQSSPSRPKSTTPTWTSRARSARTCSKPGTSGLPPRSSWRSWRRSNLCLLYLTWKPPWTDRLPMTIRITLGRLKPSKWPSNTLREVDYHHHYIFSIWAYYFFFCYRLYFFILLAILKLVHKWLIQEAGHLRLIVWFVWSWQMKPL